MYFDQFVNENFNLLHVIYENALSERQAEEYFILILVDRWDVITFGSSR